MKIKVTQSAYYDSYWSKKLCFVREGMELEGERDGDDCKAFVPVNGHGDKFNEDVNIPKGYFQEI